jgi:photosystem II stability/assembly factor-like uncharacterized protein
MKRLASVLFFFLSVPLYSQWTTSGPEGGTIPTLVIDPHNGNVLYVGTAQSIDGHGRDRGTAGIFRSTDHGKTWAVLPNSIKLTTNAFNALVAPPASILLAGTWGQGVLLSRDGGATWTNVSNNLAGLYIHSLASTDGKTIYVGADYYISASTNSGATWINTGVQGSGPAIAVAADPQNPFVGYASMQQGDFAQTADGGATWKPINNCALFPRYGPRAPNSILPGTGPARLLYAATSYGFYGASVAFGPPCFFQDPFWNITSIRGAMDPSNSLNLFVGPYNGTNVQLFNSTNGGFSWTPYGSPLSLGFRPIGGASWSLAFDPHTRSLFVTTSGPGVFEFRRGRGPVTRNSGLNAHDMYAIAVFQAHANIQYAATGDDGVFKTVNGGLSWAPAWDHPDNPFTWSVAVDPTNPDKVFAGTDIGLYQSTNGGQIWTLISPPTMSRLHAIVFDPTNPSIIYVGGEFGNAYSTQNGGATWRTLQVTSSLSDEINAFVVDPLVPTTLYAATTFDGVLKSTNGGAAWTAINNGLLNLQVKSLSIRPDAKLLYAGTEGGGVFVTDSGGVSWWGVNVGLTNMKIEAVAVDPGHPDVVYAGTFGDGVWRSTDRGKTWSAFNAGSPNPFIHALALSPGGDVVYAGTAGSVWSIRP